MNAEKAGLSPTRELAAFAAVSILTIVIGIAGIWATSLPSPPQVWSSSGPVSITWIDASRIMEKRLIGPGCEELLRAMQIRVEGRTAYVSIPRMGEFEERVYYSGAIIVKPTSPLTEHDDCRFNPRFIGKSE